VQETLQFMKQEITVNIDWTELGSLCCDRLRETVGLVDLLHH